MGHTNRTWIGLNGEVFCTLHAGHYLASAVSADPNGTSHQTPLNEWIDTAAFGVPDHLQACEVCR